MNDFNPTESRVLEAIRIICLEDEPYYGMVRDIAMLLHIDKSYVSNVISRLVASGHILRVRRGVYCEKN